MANIADCALAFNINDIDKLDGVMSPTDKKDGLYYHEITEYENYTLYHNHRADLEYQDHFQVLDKRYGGIESFNDWGELRNWLDGTKHTLGVAKKTEVDKWYEISNGYKIDWHKLGAYSYEFPTYIEKQGDIMIVYFGGRWDFPSAVEDYLNSKHIKWQGAGVEDGCNWQYDEFGTADMGLRVTECEPEDGDEYIYHTISYVGAA